MNVRSFFFPAVIVLMSLAAQAQAVEMPLYETGPSQDAAFVRFVNARSAPMEVKAGGGSQTGTTLQPSQPVSPFYTVRGNASVKGIFKSAGLQSDIALKVKPGEFATVVAMPGGAAIAQTVLRESPDDFNALKVSLAFYNLDAQCAGAGLNVVGRNAALFENVASGALQRRALNPVSISVQLICKGQVTPAKLALGTLQAGQRYSIFVMSEGVGSKLLIATDTVAR
jgi:alginate O-acetyltransferase complex protein AlgF